MEGFGGTAAAFDGDDRPLELAAKLSLPVVWVRAVRHEVRRASLSAVDGNGTSMPIHRGGSPRPSGFPTPASSTSAMSRSDPSSSPPVVGEVRPRFVAAASLLAVVLISSASGCRIAEPCGRRHVVEAGVAERFGAGIGPAAAPGVTFVPDGVVIEDGVTADEAVTTALWNNAAFREALAQLGVSRGQLLDAGLLPDPQFQLFFPVGPKQLEFTVFQQLTAIWLRPIRQRAADLDFNAVAERLVQTGMDTIRDVRVAHADLLAAQERLDVADETLELRREIARLAERRLEAGDVSELDAAAPEIDALQAREGRLAAVGAVETAQARLVTLMSLPGTGLDLVAVGETPEPVVVPSGEELLAEACAVRPDLRAAELDVIAATERLALARKQWTLIEGIADFNERGSELGPGVRFTIPVFNANRGLIAVAEGNLDAARSRYFTLLDLVRAEVLTARTGSCRRTRCWIKSSVGRCRRPRRPRHSPGKTSRGAACRICSPCKRPGSTSARGSGGRTRRPKCVGPPRNWNAASATGLPLLRPLP